MMNLIDKYINQTGWKYTIDNIFDKDDAFHFNKIEKILITIILYIIEYIFYAILVILLMCFIDGIQYMISGELVAKNSLDSKQLSNFMLFMIRPISIAIGSMFLIFTFGEIIPTILFFIKKFLIILVYEKERFS